MARALLLMWAAAAALHAAAAPVIRPSELFMPGGLPKGQQIAFLPQWALLGVPLGPSLPGVPSASQCAARCREALPRCSFFNYCPLGTAGGCSTDRLGQLQGGDCQLLWRNCTVPADRVQAPGVTAGFPVHNWPGYLVEAFPTFLTQGVIGADFPCPTSEVKDKDMCAFHNEVTAISVCVRLPECNAFTVYANGTNGCEAEPLAVLKTQVPSDANTFVSSDVYTVVLTNTEQALRHAFLFADQTQLDLPSEEEILGTGADEPTSLEYKGCRIAAGMLYRGKIVDVLDQHSPQACCRECAARNANASSYVCTAFNYCAQPGGCSYTHEQDVALSMALAQGQCQLRYQPVSFAVTAAPPVLLAHGESVQFTGGTPLLMWAPEVPGFERRPGETVVITGAFPCEASLRPETGECVKPGGLQELADFCSGSSECATLSYRLGPQANSTAANDTAPTIGSFKANAEVPYQIVFPLSVMYVKEASASSGLSAGAVAGIAVGAAAGAGAVAACAWLLLRGRRQRQQQPPRKGAAQEEGAAVASPLTSHGSNGMTNGDIASLGGRTVKSAGSSDGRVPSRGLSGEVVPELVAHMASHEAALMSQLCQSTPSGSTMEPEQGMMLPPHLRQWVVDASEVIYLRRPNGQLWELGAGAGGRVYRVEYRGEVLAAKEVEIGFDAQLRETFVKEAIILHQLRHPNVVGFAGVTFYGTKGVMLMEYCDARDLHSALQVMAEGSQQRLFSWHRRGKRVALDIAKALNFLHQNNIVHMDVKSPNILLTATGTAKLADCGFSKIKHDGFLSTVSLVGTFAWAAPELLIGMERPTQAVDIYSLGVVLHEIITGEQPQRGRLRMPRDDECPEEVRALMLACLADKPSERPTALEVLRQLRAMVEQGHSQQAARSRAASGLPSAAAGAGSPSPVSAAAGHNGGVQCTGTPATGAASTAAPNSNSPRVSIEVPPAWPSPFAAVFPNQPSPFAALPPSQPSPFAALPPNQPSPFAS